MQISKSFTAEARSAQRNAEESRGKHGMKKTLQGFALLFSAHLCALCDSAVKHCNLTAFTAEERS